MDTKTVYLCAGCGINEAEKEESLCGDCIRKLMRLQVSWTKEDTVENFTILESTIQQDFKLMMDGWDTIMKAARKQFPDESEAKLFAIASVAMNHAIDLQKKSTSTHNGLESVI
ncbi:MAG: hypothetical protein WA974_16660 [Thermodesulfobacteriota bacterium]